MRKLLITLMAIFATGTVLAQKTCKVEAEYTFVAPENTTIEQAKLTALDRAKIQAIADEFGTLVSQSNTTYIENKNGNSNISFQSLGRSDVKGEWIETIGEPLYEINYDQNMLFVKVKVKGRIREINKTKVDLRFQLLCNGTDSRFERNEFKNGDELYVRFQSPIDGFLIIYLVDYSADKAYCLLPYSQSDITAQEVHHDKEYIFFSSKAVPIELRDEVDEYVMTCNGAIERNDIYAIFSPNEFKKTNNLKVEENMPRELSLKEFNEWLSNIQKVDNKLQILNQLLTIKN